MWFNNALIYNFKITNDLDLQQALTEHKLKPCPPHARFTYGWVPPVASETNSLVHTVAGAQLIALGKEERILPAGVVKLQMKKKIEDLETQRGRPLGRAEKAQLTEDLEFDLLPKAFCIQKQLLAILDTVKNRLIINTASPNQADQLISILRKSINGIQIESSGVDNNLAVRFAEWINNPVSLPAAFQWATDCLLISLKDEKKRFTCKGYELSSEEIVSLLTQGLAAAEISLLWNDRLQFTLTQDFVLKRIKCQDYLIDEINEASKLEEQAAQNDAALALLSGELRGLIDDLLASFSPLKVPNYKEHNLEEMGTSV